MIDLKKRLSVGVSFGIISENEICAIITKYSNYIHDLFFSPTEGIQYLTRTHIYDLYNSTNNERRQMLANVLDVARKNRIKTSLTLNTPCINMADAYKVFLDYKNQFHFDYLTTTYDIATTIKDCFPETPIICSYNEAITNYNKLNRVVKSGLYDYIVLGNKYIRDKKAFDIISNGNLKAILLVNNGCTFNCSSFCKNRDENYCENLFYNTLSKEGIEQMYSKQSVFPEELELYEKCGFNIDLFKLSSRPISYTEFDDLLSSYTTLESRTFISNNVYNYHLYARLSYFGRFYKRFDYNKIVSYKEKLWSSFNSRIT